MATKNKTAETEVDVYEFIKDFVDNEQKRDDSRQLITLMEKWSGYNARMWGPSIIGFGSYHYKYASGHEGDCPLIGFSPRKAAFSLYVSVQGADNKVLLEKLGKFKMAVACIYIKKLADIDVSVLEKLCKATIKYIQEHYECPSRN